MINQYGILWGRVEFNLPNKEIDSVYKWGYLLAHVAKDKEQNKQRNQLYLIMPSITMNKIIYGAIELTTNMRKFKQTRNPAYLVQMRPVYCGGLIDVIQHILTLDNQKSECNFEVYNGKELRMKAKLMGITKPTTYKLEEVKNVLRGQGTLREIFWGRRGSDYYTAVLNEICEVEIKKYGVSSLLTNYNGKYANIVGVDGKPEFKEALAREHLMGEPIYPKDLKIEKLTNAGVRIQGEIADIDVEDIVNNIKATPNVSDDIVDNVKATPNTQMADSDRKADLDRKAKTKKIVEDIEKLLNESEKEPQAEPIVEKSEDTPIDVENEEEPVVENIINDEDIGSSSEEVEADNGISEPTETDDVESTVDTGEEGTSETTETEEIKEEPKFLHPLQQDIAANYYLCKPYKGSNQTNALEFRNDYGCFGKYSAAIRWLDKFGEIYAAGDNVRKLKQEAQVALFDLIDNKSVREGDVYSIYKNRPKIYAGLCFIFYPTLSNVPIWDLMVYHNIKSSNFKMTASILYQNVLERYKALYTDTAKKAAQKGAFLKSYKYALMNFETSLSPIIREITENCPMITRCIRKFGRVNLGIEWLQEDIPNLKQIHDNYAQKRGVIAEAFENMGTNGIIDGEITDIKRFQNKTPIEQALVVMCMQRNKQNESDSVGYYAYLDGTSYIDIGYLLYNASPLFLYYYKSYMEHNFIGRSINMTTDLTSTLFDEDDLIAADIAGRCNRFLVDTRDENKNKVLEQYITELRVRLLDDMTEREGVLNQGLLLSYERYIKKFTTQLEMSIESAFLQLGKQFCEGIFSSIGYTKEEMNQLFDCFTKLGNQIGVDLVFPLCAYLYATCYGARDVYWYNYDNTELVNMHIANFEIYKRNVNNEVFSDFLNVFTYVLNQKQA